MIHKYTSQFSTMSENDCDDNVFTCDTCNKECREDDSGWCQECRDKDECICDICKKISNNTEIDKDASVVFCESCGLRYGFTPGYAH
jgi:hypothetical protein